MLLRPCDETGEEGKVIFHDRMRRFLNGEWEQLLQEAAAPARTQPRRKRPPDKEEVEEAKRRTQAERKIRQREITRARILLTSSGLAPGSPETLWEIAISARGSSANVSRAMS